MHVNRRFMELKQFGLMRSSGKFQISMVAWLHGCSVAWRSRSNLWSYLFLRSSTSLCNPSLLGNVHPQVLE